MERGTTSPTRSTEAQQYLLFRLLDEEYGVEISRVREIVPFGVVTRVPRREPWMLGVMNLRGRVLPVVDLAMKFGRPERPRTTRTCIVLVEHVVGDEPCVVGIVADAMSRVITLASDEIDPPPPFGSSIDVDYLAGLGRLEDRFALLLDLDHALKSDVLATMPAPPDPATTDLPEVGRP
jgi:purine-binding chemotaxis protein CheW